MHMRLTAIFAVLTLGLISAAAIVVSLTLSLLAVLAPGLVLLLLSPVGGPFFYVDLRRRCLEFRISFFHFMQARMHKMICDLLDALLQRFSVTCRLLPAVYGMLAVVFTWALLAHVPADVLGRFFFASGTCRGHGCNNWRDKNCKRKGDFQPTRLWKRF